MAQTHRPPIALQLYTLRQAVARDLEGTLREVAAMGYAGVEPFGLTPTTALETRRLCDELGLSVPSVHVPMPVGELRSEVVEAVTALGARRMVSSLGPADLEGPGALGRAVRKLGEAHEVAAANGLAFGVHNHWWEYQEVDGRMPYRVLLAELPPDVFFELDVYWMQTAGVDPALAMAELAGRAPLLHVKDGPAQVGKPMVALGDGSLDIPAIVAANAPHSEWLIVELDECATDMLAAVERSLDYLVTSGLGMGRDRAS